MHRIGMQDPILWAYVPQAESLLDKLKPSFVLYHCVDDIAAQKGVDAASFRAAEERFARRADLVIASAPALAKRMRGLADRVLEAPNVADTELFAAALEPGPIDPALAALPEPRLVFTGAVVATKLDFELLAELAALRPHWSIALVGALGAGDPSTRLSGPTGAANVHALGPRRYRELPNVLRGAAVGLIPYAINELTRSVFPMKVYEYLAAGLPVLATPLPSLGGVEEITFAASASEAADRLDEILAEDTPARRHERSRRAAGHSWEARIQEIAAEMDEIESSRECP
jgi:glycosyltransferase involved in cell wall biosynthesis